MNNVFQEEKKIIDKKYCMSSYMAFCYIEKDDMDFSPECTIAI